MRLGQVKRTYNIETSKIVTFLKDNGVEISNHPNSKLTEEQLELVLDNLKPKVEVIAEPITEQNINTNEVKEVTINKEDTKVKVETPKEIVKEEPQIGEVIEIKKEAPKKKTVELETEDENIEVIRAPKQKVEGLKVLGKIDLPEPKVKPEDKIEEKISENEDNTSSETVEELENNDPLAHLHPTKRAKLKAKEKIEEVNSKELKVAAVKKKKKEKSISEKIAEQKKQKEKRKKANPHKHIKKSGIHAQRIEISEDGTILPKDQIHKKNKAEKELGFFGKIWKWFNT